jgi:hypothetical protein
MAKYFKYHLALQHDLDLGFKLVYTRGPRFKENHSCGPLIEKNVLRFTHFL